VAADDIAWVLGGRHIVKEDAEEAFGCGGWWKRMLRGNEQVRSPYILQQEVEGMTSWVGCCDAISVARRFTHGCDRGPERSHSLQLDVRMASVKARGKWRRSVGKAEATNRSQLSSIASSTSSEE
jgi:hypothetical protein